MFSNYSAKSFLSHSQWYCELWQVCPQTHLCFYDGVIWLSLMNQWRSQVFIHNLGTSAQTSWDTPWLKGLLAFMFKYSAGAKFQKVHLGCIKAILPCNNHILEMPRCPQNLLPPLTPEIEGWKTVTSSRTFLRRTPLSQIQRRNDPVLLQKTPSQSRECATNNLRIF